MKRMLQTRLEKLKPLLPLVLQLVIIMQHFPKCMYVQYEVLLSYIQKEMQKLHTETTRSSDYLLKTVLPGLGTM